MYLWLCVAFTLCFATARGAVQNTAPDSGYLPGTEYVYSYSSTVALLDKLALSIQAKLSVQVVVGMVEGGGVELLVTVSEATLSGNTSTGSYADGADTFGDLTKWFSVVQEQDGSISHVLYPSNEASAVVAFKKSLAGLLSRSAETDSSREVAGSTLVVREQRTTQHGPQMKTANKVFSFDSSGLLVAVELQEAVQGQHSQHQQGVLLSPTILSRSTITLVEQLPSPPLLPRPNSMLEDSLEVSEWHSEAPLPELRPLITEKLLCAEKGEPPSCLRDLVAMLRRLSENDLSSLAQEYFETSDQRQALFLVDALAQLGSPRVSRVLAHHVLRSVHPARDDGLVRRALFHLATAVPPEREAIAAVWELAFSDEAAVTSSGVRHQSLLTLGAMAKAVREREPQMASEVVQTLHSLLERHAGHQSVESPTRDARSAPPTLTPRLRTTLIDSLGNAGAQESLPILVDHVTVEGAGLSVRHAAVRALRGYSCEESASALLRAAESSPHPTVRQLAARAYQEHPLGTADLSHILETSSPHSSRLRRHVDSPVSQASNVVMPAVSWNTHFGEENISTDLRRMVLSSFQIEPDTLSSRYQFSLHDEASFQANLLLSDGEQHSEMLRTELCLQGEATYDLNILTDFTQNLTAHQFNRHSSIVASLMQNFQSAYDDITASEAGYSDVGANVHTTLDSLPDRFSLVEDSLSDFLAQVSAITASFELKTQAEAAFSDINATFTEAYSEAEGSREAIGVAVDTILPSRPREVVSSLMVEGGQPFTTATFHLPYLPYAPQKAMANIFTVYRRAGEAFADLQSSVEEFEMLTDPYGPNRQWLSPSLSLQGVRGTISFLLEDLTEAIDTADKSPTQSYDGASLSELQSLREAVASYLEPSLSSLEGVATELLAAASQLSSAFQTTSEAYDSFTSAYEVARSEIDTVFGQRFHPEFPRQLRSCDPVGGCGTYPSSSGGLYRSGVDLATEPDSQLITPVSGYLRLLDPTTINSSLSYSNTSAVILQPAESSFNGIYFVISNIVPDSSITSDPRFYLAGDSFATPDSSIQIGGASFIHIEAYQVLNGTEHSMDAAIFLQPRLNPEVSVQFDCNDFVTYVGGVVVDRRVVTNEELETRIAAPLVEGIPGHEFPQPHDLVLESDESLTSADRIQFFQSSTFLMVGSIPVQFDFTSVGQYQLNFSLSASLLSKHLQATVSPYLHARTEGTVRMGATQFAQVEIAGSLVETALPLTLEQNFQSWPLVASSSMDVVLAPTSLNLTSQLVQTTGAGEFADQETLEAQTLWEYSIPPLNRDEFYYEGALLDDTPPVFIPLSHVETDQSDCFVRQLPGRQYSNPAFELEFEVVDWQSVVNVTYKVGSFEMGGNIIPEKELGGKRVVVPNELIPAHKIFFTVSATNLNGGLSIASCQLPVFDRSPPMARVTPVRSISSHPSRIQALVVLFDEFGFEDSLEIAMGTVPGEYGDDTLPWRPFNTALIYTPPDLAGNVYNLFSFSRNGRLVGDILETIPIVVLETDCATMCMTRDSCKSFDYSRIEANCILHSNIEGPVATSSENNFYTPPLQASQSYYHFEKLGVGNSTLVDLTGLNLQHGTLYYINMRLRNQLGYASFVSSNGILIDFTPPIPGKIRNPAMDVLQADGCSASSVTAECIEESGEPNHRVIEDGPGSTAVFNGPTPLLDAMYTSATNYITANWEGFRDAESGVFAYTWCVGTSIGSCDILSPTDPHAHLTSREAWTNTGLASSLNLSDGSYYFTVQAVNSIEYGGPLVTTVRHRDPYVVDTSPPLLTGVEVVGYNDTTNELLLVYNTSDPGSGIRSVSVALGQSALDTALLGWREVEGGEEGGRVSVEVEIPDGVPTWIKLRATNNARLQTIVVASNNPVMADRSPPTPGYLNDGVEGDADYQYDLSTLCINGGGFEDQESGISEILWGIGTVPGFTDFRGFTPLSDFELLMGMACMSGLALVTNATYYSTVMVRNGAINTQSVTVTSDGVHTDNTPPIAGFVYDGPTPQVDQSYSSSLTTVAANWNRFTDYESGISHYILTVLRQPYRGSEEEIVHRERVDGNQNQILWSHFTFTNGDQILVQLEAFNGAGLSVSVNSTGVRIDLTPSEVVYLVDGDNPVNDVEYVSDSDRFFAVWNAIDDQSGISQIEGAIFELREGRRVRVYPDPFFTDAPTEVIPIADGSWSVTGLALTTGSRYIAALTFTNGAGLRAQYETNGVTVDTTPPIVESVSVVSDTYVDLDSSDPMIVVANLNQIEARWRATDSESGILEYIVGVVDENSTTDMPPVVQNFGMATGGLIRNLTLTPGGEYRVAVAAINLAGVRSELAFSEAFRVAPGDSAGVVFDGEDPSFVDVDYTDELTAVTAHFYGFSSQLCGGISHYEWAVGVEGEGVGRETVLPFTDSGIVVVGTNGSGYAQVLLPDLDSYEDQPLYITVRGITGCGGLLESTSSGFIIDPTPPSLDIIGTGSQAIERAQSVGGGTPDNPNEFQDTATFSSVWEVGDGESGSVGGVRVRVGTYPGGDDVSLERAVSENYIRGQAMSDEGLPNYVTVTAENGAGLEAVAISNPIVLDTSPPTGGELECEARGYPDPTLVWSEQLTNTGVVLCTWRAVGDPQSRLIGYSVAIGTIPGDQSVMSLTPLVGNSNSFTSPILTFDHNTAYYVTLYVTNGAGLEGIIISDAVYFDTSPPVFSEGAVFVLPNSAVSNVSFSLSNLTEADMEEMTPTFCLLDTDVAVILFTAPEDMETDISRYEIGLGFTPGSDDLLAYQLFSPTRIPNSTDIYHHTLSSLTFEPADRRAVHFNVKAHNGAGRQAILSSGPVFIKSVNNDNAIPTRIYDGENPNLDIDYQTSTTTIGGHFQIGTNCPLRSVQWAVEGVDGEIVHEYTDISIEEPSGNAVQSVHSISTDQVQLYNDETYRILVQATDYTGEVHILRSDGITVTTDFLLPGLVQDGPISGQDLNYQESTTMLYAHWSGFGDNTPEQEIAFYEIAAGSDREYPNTRSDIAPFTNVGLNTSFAFTGLNLVPQSVVYYVTVRAYSVSGASVDSTSNGITAGYGHMIVPGSISVIPYQADTTTLSAYWTEFESDLPIRSYEWALGTRYLATADLEALCEDTDSDFTDQFEVFGFELLGLDTSATATGLHLQHNTTYYTTVRAIDQAKKCLAVISDPGLLIDTTPPEPYSVTAGPRESRLNIGNESEYVAYVRQGESLDIFWEEFVDDESGIQQYEVAVFEQLQCGNNSVLGETFFGFRNIKQGTSVSFEDLGFESGVSYVVEVKATNFAGLSSSAYSQPIILDSTTIVPGTVKDGLNWEMDLAFQSVLSMLSGVFTHAKLPPQSPGEVQQSGPCPETTFYNLSVLDPFYIETNNLIGTTTSTVVYEAAQISISDAPPVIKITAFRDRDSGEDRIISGAYQTLAQISRGGLVSLDILAATGVAASDTSALQAQAITSVVFIDSGTDTNLLAEFELDLAGDFEYPDAPTFSAFGLQIHRNYSNGTQVFPQRVVMWAKSDDPLSSPVFVVQETAHDLSQVHTYSLDFQFEQLDAGHSRKVDLYIDGSIVASLHGLPGFSDDVRIVLHVFNRLGFIPVFEDLFENPTVESVFGNVTLPLQIGHLCDYGTPFYSEQSPIIQFWAGIGTTPGALDIRELELLAIPCLPCLPGPCLDYACDTNCTLMDPYTLPFTFSNLSLSPGYYTNTSQSNAQDEFQSTNENAANTMISLLTNYFQPAVYYITVKAVTASGQTITATSNGVTIDISPPELVSPIEHFDVSNSASPLEPTRFQGSNSTISARWQFRDLESGISEYLWAIGSSPYGDDIQLFESVGMATQATNSSLLGLLEHNTTYYVTVTAVSGSGLSANATSSGVTYIATELNQTEVAMLVQVEFTEVLVVPGENGDEVEIILTEREDRASISWEGVGEEVEEIFWSIGSSSLSDDILPQTEVSFNEGTSATIDSGVLFIDSTAFANISEIIALDEGREEDPDDSLFSFEPGRLLFHSLQLCNFVHRCVVAETSPVIVIRTKDFEAVSTEGDDVTVVATQEGSTASDLVPDQEYRVTVETNGGLNQGARLFVGFLNSSDLTQRYRVMVPYISNPYETMAQTSRQIARRFTEIGGPSFYVSFLGQDSLSGPLELNVTLERNLDWTIAEPELAYWDIDDEVWREVGATCGNQLTVDLTSFTVAAEVCSTVLSEFVGRPESLARRRRQVEDSSGSGSGVKPSFLDRPTQFTVIRIGNLSTNTAPQLDLPVEPLIVEEDIESIYDLSGFYSDAEGDVVNFYLASVPRLGNATLSLNGLLSYTPCSHCIGLDTLEIVIIEQPVGVNIIPMSASGQLCLEITNRNDIPEIFFYDSSFSASSDDITANRTVYRYIDSNRTAPTVVARIAALDYDAYHDDLTISVTGQQASVGYRIWLDVVNTPESLPVNWFSDSEVASYTGYITFVGADITYEPFDTSFVGIDQVSVLVRDSRGVFSETITVVVEVLPSLCENNGVCGGSELDPNCTDIETRRAGFEDYNCSCLSGFEGLFCEIETDVPIPAPTRACPSGVPIVLCGGDPCATEGAACPSHPAAECRPNYCGNCRAEWYEGDTMVQCTADLPDVCSKPLASFLDCSTDTCDCPEQPYTCPVDSILVETRQNPCCVTYECVCPNISCPFLMENGQGVQPIPNYRGNGFPGRCCPEYRYEDINECVPPAENRCSEDGICQNEQYSYSCTCAAGATLAQDGVNCGVCPYNEMEYLLGDRVKIGCNWCICQSDTLSAERWHCTAATCEPGCIRDGLFYSVGTSVVDEALSCTCVPTDTNAEWICSLDSLF